jgi:hypothetical protein
MRAALGSVRLAIASVMIILAAWVVSWQVLWDGLSGNDSLYHLHLVRWVADTFPVLHWWYRWDAMGVSYREGYPLVPSWITVAVAHLNDMSLDHAMQLVQFAINPLCAIGIYAYCAWRMGRPLVGLVAGILYLLSPITYTFLLNWGFYASQMGTILVMPAVIAIDVFCEEWQAGNSGWRYRLSALSAVVLIAVTGLVSPTVVGAPLAAIVAYTLAVRGGWRRQLRWLFVATPLLGLGWLATAAFWVGPLNDYLSLIASRHPAQAYDPLLFPHWDFDRMLQLQPIRATHVEDQVSFVPAVWVPAVAGAVAMWDRRVRVLVALAFLGFVITSVPLFDQIFYSTPIPTLLNNRTGLALVQFTVPVLAGFGLMGTLPTAAGFLMPRLRSPRVVHLSAAAALGLLGLVLATVDVGANFASSHDVGADYFPPSNDIWERHLADPCGVSAANSNPLCGSVALSSNFNVLELQRACRAADGSLRRGVSICAALKDIESPTWDSANDAVITRTVSDCRSGSTDPVCSARYQTLEEQIFDRSQWRSVQVGCFLPGCPRSPSMLRFASPPQRMVLDAHSAPLLMAFHDLSGGGQFYTYNFQDISSAELSDYMKSTMLDDSGAAQVKQELANISGADAIALAPEQAGLASVYTGLGWTADKSNSAAGVYLAPSPSGLAAEWPGGSTVLVVGKLSSDASNPYNQVFKEAARGVIPFSSGWLVRSRSAYIDDYSDSELAAYSSLVLFGYQYHDASTAWQRLDHYVRNGGRLFVETGWQYTDPDWNLSTAYSVLPVNGLGWGALDPKAGATVEGVSDPSFGSFAYQGGGWGASGASQVRPGADALVTVGGKVVVARWSLGRGEVLWSGMNLLAHSDVSKSPDESGFIARQFAWLLGTPPPPPVSVDPTWIGDDEAHLALPPASGPTAVLFKESIAPGWSAELRWPGGSSPVDIQPAEMDFMLVRLNSVPAGATLVFRYGPTWRVYSWWAVSALALILMVVWVGDPAPYRWAWVRMKGSVVRLGERARWSADSE